MNAPRPIPVVDDHDTGPIFAGAARGEISVRVCDDCGHALHVPIAHCNRCGGWNTSFHTVAGTGTVYSWTVVAHQVHPAFAVPYTLVLVELDELDGVRMIASLPGEVELEAGQAMEAWFEPLADGVVIPQWRPRAATADAAAPDS